MNIGTCVNCKYAGRPTYKSPCSECHGYSKHEAVEIRTNGDRFRALSDEELSLWARKQIGCGFDFFPCGVVCDGKCDSFDEETCKAKIMEYLKQPVEEVKE